MTKPIVFDLWETVASNNLGISKSLQERFAIPSTPDYIVRFERATQLVAYDSPEAMAESFLAEFGIPADGDSVRSIVAIFQEGMDRATFLPGMEELLGELKQHGVRLGLLSNTSNFSLQACDRLGLVRFMEAMVFSWQTGVLKPAPESFQAIADKLGVALADMRFVDDGEINVQAARGLGIETIRFIDVQMLRQALRLETEPIRPGKLPFL